MRETEVRGAEQHEKAKKMREAKQEQQQHEEKKEMHGQVETQEERQEREPETGNGGQKYQAVKKCLESIIFSNGIWYM